MRLPLASIAGCAEKRGLLSLVTVKDKVCEFSSEPPPFVVLAKLLTVVAPASSLTVSPASAVLSDSVGASFTAVTFRVKVWVVEFVPPASSSTYRLTVADPLALAAGV